jgi:hypothetical protein
MRPIFVIPVLAAILSFPVHAAESLMRKPTPGAPAPSAPIPVSDEVMKAFHQDLQSARADIMAKNLTLTAEEAAKFWPAYAKFQEEQNAITAPQLESIKNYVNGSTQGTLDDKMALALVDANLTRDLDMNKLRRKWLAEFQKFLPARTAVRVMQIDRRLGLAGQMEMSARIPLAR